MAQVEQYLAGAQARSLAPGDFILTHRHNWMAGLITQAQKRRFHGPDAVYAHWSHAAVVAPGGTVIEAEIRGVVRNPIARYRDDEYRLVRLDSQLEPAARERVVEYATARIGQAFGFLDMFGTSVYLVTGLPMRVARKHHEICSSLVVRALQQGGLLEELDPILTLPADLAKRFDVRG
jgi:uncharacterized protein YycO